MKLLKIGAEGADVKKWQYFLLGQGLYQKVVDGKFGPNTQEATKQFQSAQGLNPDGIVGNITYGKAMLLGFGLVTDTRSDITGEDFPKKPGFPPLVSNSERANLLGTMAYRSKPFPGNPENIEITNNWDKVNIIKVAVPQLIPLKGTPTVYFHKKGANQLVKLFADWQNAGLLHKILTWEGAYNPRFVRGSITVLSNHAFGTAFDINYSWNKLGVVPALVGQKGSVRELVEIANKNGFYWGGHFTRKDGMHFEVAKIQ